MEDSEILELYRQRSEDAMNDNAVPEKRINVKRVAGTIAACAAAFAAVAAVPVLMMYVNGKAGNGNDQLPVTTDAVTETTEISTGECSDDHTSKNFSFVYDLVEEKKLDNNSDLFYYGEDYINQIMTELHGENYDSEYSKPERITMTEMKMSKENETSSDIYGIPDWMYDISVTGRYRDLSGVIKCSSPNNLMEQSPNYLRTKNGFKVA